LDVARGNNRKKIDGARRRLVVKEDTVKAKSFCKMPIRVRQPDGSYMTVTFKKSAVAAPEPAPEPDWQKGRRDITPAWRVARAPPAAPPVATAVNESVWRAQRPDIKADILNELFGERSLYSINDRKNEHNLMKFLYRTNKSTFSVSDIHSSHGDVPHYSIRINMGVSFATYHAYPCAANPAKIDKVTGCCHGVSYVLVERRY